MQLLYEYWYIFIGAFAVVAVGITAVKHFSTLPTENQIAMIKEWLKYAVMEAEKELGSGTGQAKLRYVYDMALEKFSWLSVISFDRFSCWVDLALEWLDNQLENNERVKEYVRHQP